MTYIASPDRYEGKMHYRRTGRSGLDLPVLSLGYWHNFGDDRPFEVQRAISRRAFDLGITHHDLANNYGPPYGSAEINFGRLIAGGSRTLPRRDGDLDKGRLGHVARPLWRARLAEVRARLARSALARAWASTTSTSSTRTGSTPRRRLRRRWARSTPLCARARRSISASPPTTRIGRGRRQRSCVSLGTPLLIHQPSYSMLNRWIETEGLLDAAAELEG